ncbi:MAG: glycoside hydrolase family 10 protein [Niabella sp.]
MVKNLGYFLSITCLIILLNACSKKGSNVDDNGGGNGTPPPDPDTQTMIIPKKEMRATWMATVWGLDWPQGDYNATTQKQQYIAYLDQFKQLNMNAVFVQIKGMGDAFYNSPYEPWSGNITGTRGQNPGYDVLQFMIDEAHAREIEFHAWINPFRIATRSGTTASYPTLHSSIDPSWVVSHEKWQMYNPAIPGARQRLADIVKDIITKYDVDGIHMDDYFYPDPASAGTLVSDQTDYQTYGAGYTTIEDFRRGNVDKMIKAVHDVIVADKPAVVFSVSPTSDFAYNKNTLYADVMNWRDWIDVIIPQIYHNSSFPTRLNNWDVFNNKPYLMVGYGYYLMNNASELSTQFSLSRAKKAVAGHLLYSAKYLNTKPDLTVKLAELFKDQAIIPFLGREVAAAPAAPQNVRIEGNTLKWNFSGSVKSVVYYTANLSQEAKVLGISPNGEYSISNAGYYAVATLNADNKESAVSAPVRK